MSISTVKTEAAKKTLRFAALRRVSTEQQEKEGNSLATQTTQIEQAVASIAENINATEKIRVVGKIVGWYGGQEHATPGHEKKEITRLLADAKEGKFDAVIVTDADRWSRDNESSKEGLGVFRNKGIQFYTGTKEWNLFHPSDKLFLGMSAEFGEFYASNQKRKSIESRIHRAKVARVPTSGKLPFGRKFNHSSGQWEIVAGKQRIIQEAAKRYLKGESINDLAGHYEMNASNLHKILTKVSGSTWQIEFKSKDLNIKETISFNIPHLLDDKTIAAIKAKVEANRTFTHGHIKHQYVFARMISCAHCGYAMFGQTNHNGHRYYRHAHAARDRECSGAKTKKMESSRGD
jgi:site-specific DNA recombinase